MIQKRQAVKRRSDVNKESIKQFTKVKFAENRASITTCQKARSQENPEAQLVYLEYQESKKCEKVKYFL